MYRYACLCVHGHDEVRGQCWVYSSITLCLIWNTVSDPRAHWFSLDCWSASPKNLVPAPSTPGLELHVCTSWVLVINGRPSCLWQAHEQLSHLPWSLLFSSSLHILTVDVFTPSQHVALDLFPLLFCFVPKGCLLYNIYVFYCMNMV